jgi:hypothetical protein
MSPTRLALAATTADTLLSYALYIEPNPLQVDTKAVLTLVVSNSSRHDIACKKLQVTLPVGTNARDLIVSGKGIETQVPKDWSASSDGNGVVTLTPKGDAGTFKGQSVSFIIATKTNHEPGTATVRIDETASSPSQPSATRSTTIPVPKFPTQFQLGDLSATPTEVPFGGYTSLMWRGASWTVGTPPKTVTVPTYNLQYPGTKSFEVPAVGPYKAKNLKILPAVFTLTVSLAVPGQDAPMTVQRQVTVTETPKLHISDFTASKTTLSGDDKLVLKWETQLATSLTLALAQIPGSVDVTGHSGCTISGNGSPPLVVSDTAGKQLGTLTPPAPVPRFLTFVLTASDGASSVQRTLQVEILPPTIVDFVLTDMYGLSTSYLKWTTVNATTVTIAPFGKVEGSGSREVTNEFHIYTITATSGFGATTTAQSMMLNLMWKWNAGRPDAQGWFFWLNIVAPRDLPGIGRIDKMQVTLPIGNNADDLIASDAKFYFGTPGDGFDWDSKVDGGVITFTPLKAGFDGLSRAYVEITANDKRGVGRMTVEVTSSSTTHRGIYLVQKPKFA